MKEGVGSKMRQKVFHWLVAVWFLFSVSAHLLYVKRTKSEKNGTKLAETLKKACPSKLSALFSLEVIHIKGTILDILHYMSQKSLYTAHMLRIFIWILPSQRRENRFINGNSSLLLTTDKELIKNTAAIK